MRQTIDGIRLAADGATLPSETNARAAGPNVLVLTTALPDEALTIITTYVGADDVDTIAVELILAGRPAARSKPRRIPRDAGPVTHARDRCLLDHLAHVRVAVAERHRGVVAADVQDAALATLT